MPVAKKMHSKSEHQSTQLPKLSRVSQQLPFQVSRKPTKSSLNKVYIKQNHPLVASQIIHLFKNSRSVLQFSRILRNQPEQAFDHRQKNWNALPSLNDKAFRQYSYFRPMYSQKEKEYVVVEREVRKETWCLKEKGEKSLMRMWWMSSLRNFKPLSKKKL